MCVFARRLIKAFVGCSRQFPKTSALSAPHLSVSKYLFSSRSNVSVEVMKGAVSAQKVLKGPSLDRD